MSIVSDTTIDIIRNVGERVAQELPPVPSGVIPTGVEWSNVDWPDDLVDRVVDGGRSFPRRPLIVGGIALGLIVAVVWFSRRRRSSDADQRREAAEVVRTTSAA